jgi:hypothetical protein
MTAPHRRSIVQTVLIGVGALLLFVPGTITNVFGDGLSGFEARSKAPEISLASWLDGDFQDAADRWFRERFGLRFFFVKLDNQLAWSLFGRLYEGDTKVVVGRQETLIQQAYIDSYCRRGKYEEGSTDEYLGELARDLRRVQDAFEARGIVFLVVISPHKAAAYPELMPEGSCPPNEEGGRDYERGLPLLQAAGVHYVDNYRAFQAAKPLHDDVILFPRGGSHWNHLGAFYGARAILDKLGELTDGEIPSIRLDGYRIHNRPVADDVDLVDHLNLIYYPTDYPTADVQISPLRRVARPLSLVAVGGSFSMFPLELIARTGNFERVDFYFYYDYGFVDYTKGSYREAGKGPVDVKAIDWPSRILNADVVLVEINMLSFSQVHLLPFLHDAMEHLGTSG